MFTLNASKITIFVCKIKNNSPLYNLTWTVREVGFIINLSSEKNTIIKKKVNRSSLKFSHILLVQLFWLGFQHNISFFLFILNIIIVIFLKHREFTTGFYRFHVSSCQIVYGEILEDISNLFHFVNLIFHAIKKNF